MNSRKNKRQGENLFLNDASFLVISLRYVDRGPKHRKTVLKFIRITVSIA